jgi:hypothetical protein
MLLRSVLVVALLGAQTVLAQAVYHWVDGEGVMHFTDDPGSIPPKFRPAASRMQTQELGVVQTKEAPAPEGVEVVEQKLVLEPQAQPQAQPQAPAEPDPMQLERQWRSAFKVVNRKVEELESSLAAEKKRLETSMNQTVYNPLTGLYVPTNEAELIQERIRKAELELKQTRDELDDLERDASRHSIPREWRR